VTAGSFDLMVEVVCGDEDHLLGLINKRIRALPGLRTTESFVYLKLTKQTRRWASDSHEQGPQPDRAGGPQRRLGEVLIR
jgi:DNA-binding Lrp family transcriptional regulator